MIEWHGVCLENKRVNKRTCDYGAVCNGNGEVCTSTTDSLHWMKFGEIEVDEQVN